MELSGPKYRLAAQLDVFPFFLYLFLSLFLLFRFKFEFEFLKSNLCLINLYYFCEVKNTNS
jgi:hypothetical protein